MQNAFRDQAAAAMKMLDQNWFSASTPDYWGGGDNFWRTPTICMGILDYMTLTGSQHYINTIESARLVGENYIGSAGYYDDETVWGRFFLSAYFYFNGIGPLQHYASNYLLDAQNEYQDLITAWDDLCGGGVWWRRHPKTYPDNFKAINATLGLMEIALGLYAANKEQSCLQWAKKCWSWIEEAGLIAGGLVIGALNQSCLPDPLNGPVIALQGNPLGPLWSLYQATGDKPLLDVGVSIVEAAIHQMTWPTPGPWTADQAIIQARADVDWNTGGEGYHDQWGDETLFKGIFVGYLGAFTQNLATLSDQTYQAAAKEFAQVLAANADALSSNFPNGAYGMDWHKPQPSYQPDPSNSVNASLQYCGHAAFVAAARSNG